METIKTYKIDNDTRAKIVYDEEPMTPREWDNLGRLCIREHTRYTFPNELDFDFDLFDEDKKEGVKSMHKYWIFWLDCYEHSGIAFCISGQGMQCGFDTSNDCGFIAIPKEYDGYNMKEWSESKTKKEKYTTTEDEAKTIAEGEIKAYNQYLNGEVYGVIIEKKETRTNEKGETKEEREHDDSCYGFYDMEQAIMDMVGVDIAELEEI